MAGSVRIVGKVRFVYARCDADASYLAYKGLTCRFLASGNIAYLHYQCPVISLLINKSHANNRLHIPCSHLPSGTCVICR
ncbi:hypothetical protein HmCmsJML155_00189 [Escherichia coli]|nr:hypothetical protein HmCmsJML155_00189 [Escherichia coli]